MKLIKIKTYFFMAQTTGERQLQLSRRGGIKRDMTLFPRTNETVITYNYDLCHLIDRFHCLLEANVQIWVIVFLFSAIFV